MGILRPRIVPAARTLAKKRFAAVAPGYGETTHKPLVIVG
jgi:hypothetical protein